MGAEPHIVNMKFEGDFDALPLRSDLLFGALPVNPTANDFHVAVSEVFSNPEEPAAHWRVEAIRWRRVNAGPLDLTAIAKATALRYSAACLEAL